jgi:hypothetical protein
MDKRLKVQLSRKDNIFLFRDITESPGGTKCADARLAQPKEHFINCYILFI